MDLTYFLFLQKLIILSERNKGWCNFDQVSVVDIFESETQFEIEIS